jgi:hypothetical protein
MTEEIEHLEIISDSDECSSDCSDCKDEYCYYCRAELDYEENEFYDWEAGRYYCERCWNEILED